MKKTFRKSAKALAVLASAFVLFNFMSCASDDDDDPPPPAVTVSIDSEGYTAGSFYVGNEATLKAAVENSTKNVQWSVDPENIITLSSPIGQTVTITAVGKGTAVVTAKCESATKTFEVSVGTNPVTAELTELPWSVSMGTGFGSNDVFTKNVDDAGHGTWCTDNSEVPYDGIYYYGAANGYQFYAEDSGVWFNWYSSANTAVGNSTEGTRFDSYMAIATKSLQSEKNVKITVNAKAVLKPETEGGEVKQPRLAVYTGEKYVLSDTELTEEAKDYTFVVTPKQKILIGNNGPNGSYMVVYSVKAEEVDDSAISQTPAINSITVTAPEQVQQGKTTQATAAVSVQFNANKTVTWASDNESVATVSETGVITGVSAGTAKITATSTVDSTKSGSATIEVITGEVKPEAGKTYRYFFGNGESGLSKEGAIDCSSFVAEGSSPDSFLTWKGFTTHNYGVQTSDGIFSLKVVGDSVIGFVGYQDNGTLSVTYGAENTPLLTNVSASAKDSSTYLWFIYKGEETTVNLHFAGGKTNYIGELTVKPWTNEQPSVTSVTVSGDTTPLLSSGTALYTAKVAGEYYPDTSVTWSVINGTGEATIDDNGVLTMTSAGTVTVKATSVADSAVSGELEVTISDQVVSPVEGQTYEYNFCASDMSGKTGTDDKFVSWDTAASTNHGIASGTLTVIVAGKVKITLGLCAYGNGTTYVVKNGDAEITSIVLTNGDITACYSKNISSPSFTEANSRSFVYDGTATTLTISGIKYLEGLKIEPVTE